jgi:hypothetical protein
MIRNTHTYRGEDPSRGLMGSDAVWCRGSGPTFQMMEAKRGPLKHYTAPQSTRLEFCVCVCVCVCTFYSEQMKVWFEAI